MDIVGLNLIRSQFNRSKLDRTQVRLKIGRDATRTSEILNFILAIFRILYAAIFCHNTRRDTYKRGYRFPNGYYMGSNFSHSFLPYRSKLNCVERRPGYSSRDTLSSNVADGKTLFHLYEWILYAGLSWLHRERFCSFFAFCEHIYLPT